MITGHGHDHERGDARPVAGLSLDGRPLGVPLPLDAQPATIVVTLPRRTRSDESPAATAPSAPPPPE